MCVDTWAVVKQLFSDFAERFDQRSHFCIADLYGFLSILQLWRQPRSDGHARQHVPAAVVVSHTAMNLTTDETGQHPLLQTNQPDNQSTRSPQVRPWQHRNVTQKCLRHIVKIWITTNRRYTATG